MKRVKQTEEDSDRMMTRGRRKSLAAFPKIDPQSRRTFTVLGCNVTSSSDRIRMDKLAAVYQVRVVSASEQAEPLLQSVLDSPYHLQCDFKRSLGDAMDADTVVAMLDYFWLQSDWWSQRYGENWVVPSEEHCKLLAAFANCPKLSVFFLPLDSWNNFMVDCCTDPATLDLFEQHGLGIELIDWKRACTDHPLCKATIHVYVDDLRSDKERRSYFGQGRYVGALADKKNGASISQQVNHSKSPYSFAVIHRLNQKWTDLVRPPLSSN